MSISPQEIMAYVDGELDEAARDRIAAAARTDHELASRIAAEQRLRDQLGDHFAHLAKAPLPDAWIAMIESATQPAAAEIINLADARERRAQGPRSAWRVAWVGSAIAASLVLDLFAGTRLRPGGPVVATDGGLVAAGELASALDTQIGADAVGKPYRVLGTFRRDGGNLCRVFSGSPASGIACRDGSQWRMQAVLPGSSPDGPAAYRQAGSPQVQLMAMAQTMMIGDPLDANQERAARAKGWQ